MNTRNDKSIIRRVFDAIWGVISTVYRLIVMLSLLLALVLGWLAIRGGKPLSVEHNVALVLAPTGKLVEQVDEDPGQRFVQNLSGNLPAESSLSDLVDALETARDDDRITLAVLRLDDLSQAGLAQLDELRAAMADFQDAGKKILAWGPWYSQRNYYAASAADEVVLDPFGFVELQGLSLYNNYFKDALDKLGIDVNVFRVGEYKSAVEPFTRNSMSPAAREANRAWLGDLWQIYGEGVGAARGLPADAVADYVGGLREGLEAAKGDSAAYAQQRKLVSSVETLEQFRQRVGKIVGIDRDHGSFRQIHYLDYLRAVDGESVPMVADSHRKTVAEVVVQGEIVDGDGEIGQAGGDSIAELLGDISRDKHVGAVVLRIDSPGGSVWASERIRRAVDKVKQAGKPVVASMSTLAASGGYWVAMDADQIWAHDSTITGSIGVFGMIPTLDRGLGKLGVHTDGVGTTPLAGAFRIDRPLNEDTRAIIQAGIERVYREFTGGVAKARKLPLEKVQEIARGRVWSGMAAKQLGLVDQIGGLQDAADAAAQLAGLDLDTYTLELRQPDRGFASRLLAPLFGHVGTGLVRAVAPRWADWLLQAAERADVGQSLALFNDPQGIYARCFCSIDGGARP